MLTCWDLGFTRWDRIYLEHIEKYCLCRYPFSALVAHILVTRDSASFLAENLGYLGSEWRGAPHGDFVFIHSPLCVLTVC